MSNPAAMDEQSLRRELATIERRLREALTSSSDELELAKVQLQEAQLRLSATVNEARETRKQLKLQAAATRLAAASATAASGPAVSDSPGG